MFLQALQSIPNVFHEVQGFGYIQGFGGNQISLEEHRVQVELDASSAIAADLTCLHMSASYLHGQITEKSEQVSP
jgi:hypothetical protein